MDVQTWEKARVALFVAHPGHELRIYHWLERVRPRVYVLTDGSGRSGPSRLPFTTELLCRVGADPGCVYGRFSDRQVYDQLLSCTLEPLLQATRELIDDLVRHEIEWVFGDATEGFNPSHDICRLMIGNAIDRTGRRLGRTIRTLAFPLHSLPHVAPPGYLSEAVRLELPADALERKVSCARDYVPLAGEVGQSLQESTIEAFRNEVFWPTDARDGFDGPAGGTPWYEGYGERQVAAGHYRKAIRFRPYIWELANALTHTAKRAA